MSRAIKELAKKKFKTAEASLDPDYYHLLLGQISEVVFQIDKFGNLKFLNLAWVEVTGFSIDESIGKNFLSFVHADDKLKNMQKIRSVFQGRIGNSRIELRFQDKKGNFKWGDVRLKLWRRENGEIVGCIGTLVEITEHKKIEKILVETREIAIESAQAKAAFLANVSHEIRTPLNGIIGMSHMLGESELMPFQKDYLQTIKHSADALLELINDLLDFSKIEAGKMQLEHVSFKVLPLIEQTIEILKHSAMINDTRLTIECSKDLPDIATGDPFRLRQILTNLIGNAIKFTRGGSVRIRVRVLKNSGRKFQLKVSVMDSGIGIAKEALSQIFVAFSQGDNSMTRKFGGTGLGLSITKRLVQNMNGQIKVKSRLGIGSIFTFTAELEKYQPREALHSEPTLETPVAALVHPSAKRIARILIAEDNAINQKVIVGLLHGSRHHLDLVDNGQKVLEAIQNYNYDLILMDCQMPVLDGYEATAQIRKLEKATAKRIPIIAVTANAMSHERQRCLSVGMDDYISKPILGPLLIELIEKWLMTEETNDDQKAKECFVKNDKVQLVNRSTLEQLRDMGRETNSNLMEEIIDIFFLEGVEKIALMKRKFERKEYAEVGKLAHHFKSSCNGVGAESLSQSCAKLEEFCKAKQPDQISGLLNQIENTYPKIVDLLNSIRASSKAA